MLSLAAPYVNAAGLSGIFWVMLGEGLDCCMYCIGTSL